MSPRDHKPRLDGTQLAALLFETAGNGVFWVLFVQALEALYYRAQVRHENFFRPMTITAIALFVTITGHWLMDFLTAFQAFILPQNVDFCVKAGALSPAEKVYLTLSDPKAVLGSAFYVSSTLIGDGFMIYRLYIVWGRNKWIAIAPTVLCVALSVTGSMVTYLFSQSKQPIFATAGAWITACFVLTFLCNLYSTLLIAVKIFLSNRQFGRTSNATGMGLPKIMEILVESAALYSVCVVTSLITYVVKSNVQFVMVAITNPVIGIIFCMIVIRVHRASGATTSSSTKPVTGSSHAMRPVAIKITTQSHLDTDSFPKGADLDNDHVPAHYLHHQQHGNGEAV